nr:MAG TPA: DNA-packaging protein small subunit [Caudoviricetes sp.]
MAHPGGRPRKYKSVAAMEKAIEEYFEGCKGEPLHGTSGR